VAQNNHPSIFAVEEPIRQNLGLALRSEESYADLSNELYRRAGERDSSVPEYAVDTTDSAEFEFNDDGTVYHQALPFTARTMYVLNTSSSAFSVTFETRRKLVIPAGFIGAIPVPSTQRVMVQSTAALNVSTLILNFYMERYRPTLIGSGNVMFYPQAIGAANTAPVTVMGASGPTATQLVIARGTRTGVTIFNMDNFSKIALGRDNTVTFPTTTTTGTFGVIPPQGSVTLTYLGAIWFIADSGTPLIGAWDEYN
jgi:hypothetical protein